MPKHQEFWILQSSSHRCTKLLDCFKKEKKYMKSNIHLATVLANLCWARPFPLLGCAHSVINIPQALFSAAVPDPCPAAGTPGIEETVSNPACFDWPFPRQDLLLCKILQCPLTESSSDFVLGRCLLHTVVLYQACTSKCHSCPPHRYEVPLEPQGWVMVLCILLAHSSLFFSATWTAGLIHRVNVLSQH